MKIESVRAATVRAPAALAPVGVEPPAIAPWSALEGIPANQAPSWCDVVCVVTADDGTWGFGSTSFAGPVVPIINEHLATLLAGSVVESVDDLTALWDRMDRACGAHYGSSGLASYATSAVDLALWDCFGKIEGQPVWRLLGGEHRRIATYATGSAVAEYLDLGHNAVKLPCSLGVEGSADLAATLRAVAQAREVLGDGRDLMLDGWDIGDVDVAIKLGREADAYNLRWFEDAIFPEDWPGYGRLRAGLAKTTLAAGERWYGHRPFLAMAEAGTVDVLQPDPLWVGGVTPVMRIAEIARTHNLELALHCGGNDPFVQHLSTAIPSVELAEVYYGADPTGLVSSYRAFAGVASSVDGYVEASDAPGFGFEFDLGAIERSTS